MHLNKAPLKPNGESRYKNPPLKTGKTVLVVDDFCTAGFSLEAARAYIERTGANVICVSFLKTINTDYQQLHVEEPFDPYQANEIQSEAPTCTPHRYYKNIIDKQAPGELHARLQRYVNWDWPEGI